MREIKFRGKINKLPECGKEDFPYRIGKWIYGYYVRGRRVVAGQVKIFHMIHTEGTIIGFVDPKTVGQYIGRLDRNKKEMYVGDIISAHPKWNKTEMNKVIIFQNGCFGFKDIDITFIPFCDSIKRQEKANRYYEIIGNKFDNPELMEK